jgi:tRNA G18 (ribose-2'-O)-methylase SpoU
MRILPLSADGLADPVLRDFTRLTDVALRRLLEPEGGLYLAESTKVIERALRAGHRPRAVLTRADWLPQLETLLAGHPDVLVYVGDDAVLEQLTGFHLHRGALASMHRPDLPEAADLLRGARRVVIIEDVVDHTNVGAIFRSAAGLGVDAVLVTPRCADPLYRRSVRVSMGTVLQVPWTRLPEWREAAPLLHDAGFTIAALALSDRAEDLDVLAADPPERLALVLGTEGDGLSRAALTVADRHVRIPMAHGVDSLNVAAAAALAVWAVRPR